MSKGNLFLGFGRGKVGDVVFSRVGGEQIARARNRAPKNPQTPLQMVQRVIAKTVSSAYPILSPLADHSFQGLQVGTPNQSRFFKANVSLLREQAAAVINSADAAVILASTLTNFSGKLSMGAVINPYLISEGSLPPIITMAHNSYFEIAVPGLSRNVISGEGSFSYQQMVDALGLAQGDQLTFVMLFKDDSQAGTVTTFNAMQYARIIMEPSDGDMTSNFFNVVNEVATVNKPNERNEGVLNLGDGSTDNYLAFSVGAGVGAADLRMGLVKTPVAAAVIVSRLEGTVWARSTTRLVLRPEGGLNRPYESDYLGDAVQSFLTDQQSSLYLNQSV